MKPFGAGLFGLHRENFKNCCFDYCLVQALEACTAKANQASSAHDWTLDAKATQEDYGELTKASTAAVASANGNFARSLGRKFDYPIDLSMVKIPLKLKKGTGYEDVIWPMLLPDDVWAFLESKGVLRDMLAGADTNLSQFWHAVQSSDHGPALLQGLEGADKNRLLPVRLHGDDGAAYRDKPWTFASWTGISPEPFDRFCLCAIPKSRHAVVAGVDLTLVKIGQVLKDSFERLRDGIPGSQYRAVILCFQADLAFFKEFFVQQRHYGCLKMCWSCLAERTSGQKRFWDVRDQAWWQGTIFQHHEPSPQPLLTLKGFGLHMLSQDLLHTLFLGVAEDVNGSAVACLVRGGMTVLQLFTSFDQWCKAHFVQLRSTIQCFTSCMNECQSGKKYPHLKMSKGYDQKVLICFMSGLRDKFEGAGGEELWSAIYYLGRFIKTLDEEALVMTEAGRNQCVADLDVFVKMWVALALKRYVGEGQLGVGVSDFKVRDKLHYLLHLLKNMRGSRINPRIGSTFNAESFIGDVKAICATCHPNTAGTGVLQKLMLRLALHLR